MKVESVDSQISKEIIICTDLCKSFGDFKALKNVSIKVCRGEVVCIIGPSGSGKSTLIRSINGLEPLTNGHIVVNEILLPGSRKDILAIRREVGMVFQSFNLFPHLTVRRNLTLAPMRSRKLSAEEANERAERLLDRVHIADQIDKFPAQLSGGQQQRVAIARALAMEPRILMFDEPTSALDPEMINEVLEVMRELAETGITMLVVTHEMGFAREVADRIVFMSDGSIIADLPPKEFFSIQNEPKVEAFLSKVL